MKQKNYLIIIFVLLAGTLFSKKMKEGSYRGLLISDKNKVEIPFNFFVSYKGKKPLITIMNADEKILVDEIRIKGDSVSFKMPVFDTEFRTRMVGMIWRESGSTTIKLLITLCHLKLCLEKINGSCSLPHQQIQVLKDVGRLCFRPTQKIVQEP